MIAATTLMLTILSACGGGNAGVDSDAQPETSESAQIEREGSVTVIAEQSPLADEPSGLRVMPGSRTNESGAFGPLIPWPLVPIHAALLPDGRVMSFGRDADAATDMFYDIWDPAQGVTETAHLTLPNQTGTDLFCSNQLLLDNGLVLMAGGDVRQGAAGSLGAQRLIGNRDANAFDPVTNSLTRIGQLNEPRWYASMTKLTTGEVFIQGGALDMALDQGATRAELASQDGQQYRSLSGFTVDDLPWYYPRNFVDASGQIVGWAHNRSYRIDPRGNGIRTDTGVAPGVTMNNASLAVMYAPGKVLLAGGGNASAVRVNIDGAVPAYEPVPAMDSPRIWGTATVLPDGRVLVSGGSDIDTSIVDVGEGRPALHVSLYDPISNTWATGPAATRARLYHSTALLLPDASVLLGGGGLPGPITNLNAEIYYPSYLFDDTGQFAQRPIIETAPTVLNPGASFDVAFVNASTVTRVALLKGGAVTHGFDMDQRLNPLPFEQSGARISTTLPVPASRTPPGFYRLFVFNEHGVPSHGHPLRINAATELPDPLFKAEVDGLNSIGQASSSAVPLVCGPAERLIGVHGSAEDWLTSIGPICQSERTVWRSVLGPTQSGDWSEQCPQDSYVKALTGQTTGANDRLVSVQLQCQRQNEVYAPGEPKLNPNRESESAIQFADQGTDISCPIATEPSGLKITADDAGVRGLALSCR